MMIMNYRPQVVKLYKTLLYMGREYPQGYTYFRDRCHGAFMKNKDVTDQEQIAKLLKHGDFVINELKALYMLKKYRTLKRRYAPAEDFEKKYIIPEDPVDTTRK